MIGSSHFSGGANLYPDQGGGSHLAQLVRAVITDLLGLAGLRGLAAIVQADASSTAAADATNEATLVVLVNELKADYNGAAALANVLKTVVDGLALFVISAANAGVVAVVDATNTATAVTLVNDVKAKYNAAVALLNELKADLNAEGTVVVSSADAAVTVVVDASDEATAITLANDLKAKYNVAATLVNEIKADINAVTKLTITANALA